MADLRPRHMPDTPTIDYETGSSESGSKPLGSNTMCSTYCCPDDLRAAYKVTDEWEKTFGAMQIQQSGNRTRHSSTNTSRASSAWTTPTNSRTPSPVLSKVFRKALLLRDHDTEASKSAISLPPRSASAGQLTGPFSPPTTPAPGWRTRVSGVFDGVLRRTTSSNSLGTASGTFLGDPRKWVSIPDSVKQAVPNAANPLNSQSNTSLASPTSVFAADDTAASPKDAVILFNGFPVLMETPTTNAFPGNLMGHNHQEGSTKLKPSTRLRIDRAQAELDRVSSATSPNITSPTSPSSGRESPILRRRGLERSTRLGTIPDDEGGYASHYPRAWAVPTLHAAPAGKRMRRADDQAASVSSRQDTTRPDGDSDKSTIFEDLDDEVDEHDENATV